MCIGIYIYMLRMASCMFMYICIYTYMQKWPVSDSEPLETSKESDLPKLKERAMGLVRQYVPWLKQGAFST